MDTYWGEGGAKKEPRVFERFADTMAGEAEEQVHTLSHYALNRATGFYVKVRNVEKLMRMLVFQSRPGERGVCVADLLCTREQFQDMAQLTGTPGL